MVSPAKLFLSNPLRPLLPPIAIDAVADTGEALSCIPQQVQIQLEPEEVDRRNVTLADGSQENVPYVGPIELRFSNRVCCTGALVLGDQVLLGAIPMVDMDLIVIPNSRTVDVNPASPNIASTFVY